MPIVIKGTKLTPEFTESLKKIIESVEDLRARDLASRAREVDGGVEIPSGYGKLLAAIQTTYPDAMLTPVNEEEMRKSRMDSNGYFFARFKEHNEEYMRSDNNALLQIISSPSEFFDPEKAAEFLTKALSKVSPSGTHKYKIFVKYSILRTIRDDVDADKFIGADGRSIKGRCSVIPFKFIRDAVRPLPKGTKLEVVVPATEIESLFVALSTTDLFPRIPRIRFINLVRRNTYRRENRQSRDVISKTESFQRKTKQQKHREGKAQSAQGKRDTGKEINVKLADGKTRKRNTSKPQGQRFPFLVKISNIPEQLTFALLKDNLDPTEHANILKAIAESRQRKSRNPIPSEEMFFCTEANGKIIEEAFNAMTVNGQQVKAELIKAE